MAKNTINFYTGTSADFSNLTHRDENGIYFITDTRRIYKGNLKYGVDASPIATYDTAGLMKPDTTDFSISDNGTLTISKDSYLTKEETNSAIAEAISQAPHMKRVVLNSEDELPSEGDTYTIYMIPNIEDEDGNLYTEYMWINNNWEKVGGEKTDLTDYYKKEEIDEKIDSDLNWNSI